jgi:hypothetical protein
MSALVEERPGDVNRTVRANSDPLIVEEVTAAIVRDH